jgi:hypothetical protein
MLRDAVNLRTGDAFLVRGARQFASVLTMRNHSVRDTPQI